MATWPEELFSPRSLAEARNVATKMLDAKLAEEDATQFHREAQRGRPLSERGFISTEMCEKTAQEKEEERDDERWMNARYNELRMKELLTEQGLLRVCKGCLSWFRSADGRAHDFIRMLQTALDFKERVKESHGTKSDLYKEAVELLQTAILRGTAVKIFANLQELYKKDNPTLSPEFLQLHSEMSEMLLGAKCGRDVLQWCKATERPEDHLVNTVKYLVNFFDKPLNMPHNDVWSLAWYQYLRNVWMQRDHRTVWTLPDQVIATYASNRNALHKLIDRGFLSRNADATYNGSTMTFYAFKAPSATCSSEVHTLVQEICPGRDSVAEHPIGVRVARIRHGHLAPQKSYCDEQELLLSCDESWLMMCAADVGLHPKVHLCAHVDRSPGSMPVYKGVTVSVMDAHVPFHAYCKCGASKHAKELPLMVKAFASVLKAAADAELLCIDLKPSNMGCRRDYQKMYFIDLAPSHVSVGRASGRCIQAIHAALLLLHLVNYRKSGKHDKAKVDAHIRVLRPWVLTWTPSCALGKELAALKRGSAPPRVSEQMLHNNDCSAIARKIQQTVDWYADTFRREPYNFTLGEYDKSEDASFMSAIRHIATVAQEPVEQVASGSEVPHGWRRRVRRRVD